MEIREGEVQTKTITITLKSVYKVLKWLFKILFAFYLFLLIGGKLVAITDGKRNMLQ